MKRKHKRLLAVLGLVAGLGVAVSLVLTAFNDNLVFFHSPSDVAEKRVATGKRFRIGGLVEEGSVKRNGLVTDFVVTDLSNSVAVRYTGMLPDLFREGQGVVTEGAFDAATHSFVADSVLAKHDENYMPKEVADRLKEQGVWQHGGEAATQ